MNKIISHVFMCAISIALIYICYKIGINIPFMAFRMDD
nr:MAG TPA: hypothetical protein [Caudoviricetes sp.]